MICYEPAQGTNHRAAMRIELLGFSLTSKQYFDYLCLQ